MAVGTPTKIGSNNAGAVASLVVTTTAGCNIGDLILVPIAHDGADTITVSVADSRGNTYQQDAYTAVPASSGTGVHCGVFSSICTVALQTSDTITVTYSTSSTASVEALVYKVSGIASSSWKDQSTFPGGVAGSGTTPTSGNVTTTVANELLFGAMCHDTASTATAGTGFTLLDEVIGTRHLVAEYEIVAATGTYAAAYTLSGSSAARSIIVTYKAAASAGSANLMTLGVG